MELLPGGRSSRTSPIARPFFGMLNRRIMSHFFGTGVSRGKTFLQPTNTYKPSIHTTLAIIPIPRFFTWGVDSANKNTPKKCPNKNITEAEAEAKKSCRGHAGAVPSPRKRMSSLIPWILTRLFKGWVSFWESKVPFCPRFFSIAKRWLSFEFLIPEKLRKTMKKKLPLVFYCSTFPFFVTPEPWGMETRTSTPSRRMTRFNSPISCQLP